MDAVLYKTPKTNSIGAYSRSPKAFSNKISYPITKLHKENSSHSSYADKFRNKKDDRDSPSNLTVSIERENNMHPSRLYNRSSRATPSSGTLYTSPKHAEIDLITQNSEDPVPVKLNNNYASLAEKRRSPKKSEPNASSLYQKKSPEENKSQYKLKDRLGNSKDGRDSSANPTPSFDDRSADKITIYTRILNSMKTLSPKNRDFLTPKQGHSSPKNALQRTSIDLLGMNSIAKKVYGLPSSQSRKAEESNSISKKEEVIDGQDLQPYKKEPIQVAHNRQKDSQGSQSGMMQKDRESRVEPSRKPYTKDSRYSITKKLTIDIHEPLETGESETSKGGRDNSSSVRCNTNPNPRTYESYSIPKKDYDKTNLLSKSGNIDKALYNNFLRGSKDVKVGNKSITPKSLGGPASIEIKKLFSSPKNLSGMMSSQQVKGRESSLSRDSGSNARREFTNISFQNYLKSKGLKTREDSTSTTTEEVRRRPPSVMNNPREVVKTQEDEKGSTVGLKDFVTQVNAGSGMPLRPGLEIKTPNYSNQSSTKKRYNSQSTKNANGKKIAINNTAQTPLSRPNKISFAARTLGPPRDGRNFGFNINYRYMNGRNLIVRTEEDHDDSYSEFKSEALIPDYQVPYPIYYMSGIEKYLRGTGPPDDEYFDKIYKEHFLQTFQAVNFCRYLKDLEEVDIRGKIVNLERRETHKDKKTIVFDLDETLIHCNENVSMPCDAILPIKFPHGDVIDAGINIRPYAKECLEELSKDFELIIFTASHSSYANVAVDHLDPEGKYIHHRLFRDHCIITEEGLYIKDLRVLGNRDLKDVVIVDNAVYSFGYHLENGIPIIPFYFNKNDTELMTLTLYLKSLANVRDVREVNRSVFKLHGYAETDNQEEILARIL